MLKIFEIADSLTTGEKWLWGIMLMLLTIIVKVLIAIKPIKYLSKLCRRIMCIVPYRLVNIRKKLAIVELPNAYTWEKNKQEGDKLCVHGTWMTTNLTKTNFDLIDAELIKFGVTTIVHTREAFSPHPDSTDKINYQLWPNRPAESAVTFELEPSAYQSSEDITSDVIITDSHGTRHCIRKVVFKYRDTEKQQ